MYGIRMLTTVLFLLLAGYAVAPRAVQRGSPHVPQELHNETPGAPSWLPGQAGAAGSPPHLITHQNSVSLQEKDEEETSPGGSCCKGWGRTTDAAASLT